MPDEAAVLGSSPLARAAYAWVDAYLREQGALEVRLTRTQAAFRRRRAFAWIWAPGRWLANPAADVVLSIALGRADDSPRWKEVAHPSPRHWIHHLEIHAEEDLDDEVRAWLAEAAARAD